MPIDPKSLPKDPEILQQMLVDVTAQLDKTQRLLRQLLAAKMGTRSEQISADQLALFARELGIDAATTAEQESKGQDRDPDPPAESTSGEKKPRGRQALPRHLKRERMVHDLAEADKHCSDCQQALRHIGEEVSERYEYIPAQMLVIEDACQKYACACKIRTVIKPAQPIEKSTASASVLAQVIVSKVADHLPVHRQAKIFRFGLELSDQTLCRWLRQSAELLAPLYQQLKRFVLCSKVVGTDDTPVKVLDRLLPHTRTGRFWPYVGDLKHPAVVYDYTPTRERAGPERFLSTYNGYLQLDAYPAYDKFFVEPARKLVEVGVLRTPEGTFIRHAKLTPRAWARCWLTSANCTRWRNAPAKLASKVTIYASCVRRLRGPLLTSFTPTCCPSSRSYFRKVMLGRRSPMC